MFLVLLCDFFGPMAVAIMGGLTVAMALTLLFLPAPYAAWFRIKLSRTCGSCGCCRIIEP